MQYIKIDNEHIFLSIFICFINFFSLFFQYLELEQFNEAYDAFRSATSMQTDHVLAWTNLIVMLDNIGKKISEALSEI